MASTLGSDIARHGGSFDMLSLEHVDALLSVEPPLPTRRMFECFLATGLAACGVSSASSPFAPAERKHSSRIVRLWYVCMSIEK